MTIDLQINQANDYAQDIGAAVYHPHVSIIHYDEVGEIRHTLNRFNVFALFLQKEFPENLTYGMGRYDHQNGSLLAYSPGQIGGKTDDGTKKQYHGWVLLFDTTFIQGSEIEKRLASYHFFSYNSNEALFLTEEEKDILAAMMEHIRYELRDHQVDAQTDAIIKDYILLILDYCNRFYTRQFKEQTKGNNDILTRFQQLLNDYYTKGLQYQHGIPSVRYCASELYLSPGYFGDIIRSVLGESPKDYIRGYVVMWAKNLLLSGQTVTQVADNMGFEYPNHFTRLFKAETGMTPSQFLEEQQKK